jgi:uncharacterized membrane protein
MWLIPDWAPNLHPLIIHFPIVLIITAAAIELVDVVFARPAWLDTATFLYAAGAVATVAAYFTGVQAGSTVFIPGMAHPIVDDHRAWALYTAWYFGIVVTARVGARFAGLPRARSQRVLLLATSLIGVVLLQQTAERGARLVFEHGVGIIGR